jgi:hypothetical protein
MAVASQWRGHQPHHPNPQTIPPIVVPFSFHITAP